MLQRITRPDAFRFHNGEKATLPFSTAEYQRRLSRLRATMSRMDLTAVLLTSMHNVAYYSGFLYCSFGRPYACVITHDTCTTVSANIDAGQPWRRSFGDNLTYTDWQRGNYWRAIRDLIGEPGGLGVEADHFTLAMRDQATASLGTPDMCDIGKATMAQRMVKSPEEIRLIRSGAKIADIGGEAIRHAIGVGVREIDVAMAGRNALETAIATHHPDSEIRDSWVWFQSGINTDGAHNPVTTRKLEMGDILSLNTFPMISGYYTALERTLFLGEPTSQERKLWEINVGAHELGISLIRPGATCSAITSEINRYFEDHNVLQYRTFGYGHSFGILSHYYGREAGLELREDIDTVLEPGMVVSMEPMLTVPAGEPGAGGYREHDILVVGEKDSENITGFPFGPEHNIITG